VRVTLISAVLAFALVGCEPEVVSLKDMREGLTPFVGKDIQVAIASLGPPTTKTTQDGASAYRWRFISGKLVSSESEPGTYTTTCNIDFIVNAANVVTGVAYGPYPDPCLPVVNRLPKRR
jgi:hypothetical protein